MTAIKDSDILSLGYYKHGQPFSGSYRGMRYRIEKQAEKDEKGKDIGPVTLPPAHQRQGMAGQQGSARHLERAPA